MRRMNATEFKAKCLALLDEVNSTGYTIVIEKRGKPVAQLTRFVEFDKQMPQLSLRGTVRLFGDITSPVIEAGEWSALRDES